MSIGGRRSKKRDEVFQEQTVVLKDKSMFDFKNLNTNNNIKLIEFK